MRGVGRLRILLGDGYGGFLRCVVGLCYGLMWRNVEECVHEKHLLSLLFVFVILKTIIFAVQNIAN